MRARMEGWGVQNEAEKSETDSPSDLSLTESPPPESCCMNGRTRRKNRATAMHSEMVSVLSGRAALHAAAVRPPY